MPLPFALTIMRKAPASPAGAFLPVLHPGQPAHRPRPHQAPRPCYLARTCPPSLPYHPCLPHRPPQPAPRPTLSPSALDSMSAFSNRNMAAEPFFSFSSRLPKEHNSKPRRNI